MKQPGAAGVSATPTAGPAPAADPTCDPDTSLRPDALPAPAFQRAVLAALAATPGMRATSRGPFRVHVAYYGTGDGAPVDADPRGAGRDRGEAGAPLAGHAAVDAEVHLDTAFKDYRHGRIEVEGVVDEIKAALNLPGAGVLASGPFPRLAPRGSLDGAVFQVPCPFDPDLVVFYIRELPHSHVPLTASEVARDWRDAGALHAAALAKLSERTRRVPADSQGEGAQTVIGYNSGDGLDAARALLPDLMRALAEWLPGRMHVALPTRDLLLAVGDADPEFLAGARAHARASYAAGAERLAPRWYVLGDDGLMREDRDA